MNLLRRFFGTQKTNPKEKVRIMFFDLATLQRSISHHITMEDSLYGIVNFFGAISRWHDRLDEICQLVAELKQDNKKGRHDELIQKLEVLQLHFQNAGRNEFGWNRTEKGQVVTADKVFLGNIFGLWTLPVSKWEEEDNRKKGGWGYPGMENLSPYDVVSDQARKFMASHVKPISEIVDWLYAQVLGPHGQYALE